MNRDDRLKRLRFRAWHRGTKENDLIIGSFFDSFHADWSEAELAWFEAFIEENDVEISAWVMGLEPVPERCAGVMMERLQKLDFVQMAR